MVSLASVVGGSVGGAVLLFFVDSGINCSERNDANGN